VAVLTVCMLGLAPSAQAGTGSPGSTAFAPSDGASARVVQGDFNGDGKTDLAVTGVLGWDSVPVAFSTGGGQFTTTALSTPTFPALAAKPGAQIVTGDFNGDGKTDLAAAGVAGWDSVAVAFSTGGGQFTTTALTSTAFPALAATPGAKVLSGDFNGDGKTDLAVTGVLGWDSVPVAFSTGGGQFTTTELTTPLFPSAAATPGARIVAGDFNGDGKTDLAAAGVAGWDSVAMAFSTGGGQFNATELSTPTFPALAATPGARIVAGDFNGDGKADLAAAGVAGWDSVAVGFSTGGGQLNTTALSTPDFPALAAAPGAQITAGDFNHDGKSDLAATGVQSWDSVPVAFSTGGGQFSTTELSTPTFPGLAATAAPSVVGPFAVTATLAFTDTQCRELTLSATGVFKMSATLAQVAVNEGFQVKGGLWGADPFSDDDLGPLPNAQLTVAVDGLHYTITAKVSRSHLNEDFDPTDNTDEIFVRATFVTPAGAFVQSVQTQEVVFEPDPKAPAPTC
jgi:hypothetical protein